MQILALAVGAALSATSSPASGPPGTPPGPPAVIRTEIARGAAAVATITARKYPYATVYRLIRACLEKNVQERRDSDGFLVGAHLAVTSWLSELPSDLSWRQRALARHADIAEWLLPHIGLPAEEIAGIVAHTAGLTPAAEQRLLQFVRKGGRLAWQLRRAEPQPASGHRRCPQLATGTRRRRCSSRPSNAPGSSALL